MTGGYVVTVTCRDGALTVIGTGRIPDGIYVICGNDSMRQKPMYLDRYTLDGAPVKPATAGTRRRKPAAQPGQVAHP